MKKRKLATYIVLKSYTDGYKPGDLLYLKDMGKVLTAKTVVVRDGMPETRVAVIAYRLVYGRFLASVTRALLNLVARKSVVAVKASVDESDIEEAVTRALRTLLHEKTGTG